MQTKTTHLSIDFIPINIALYQASDDGDFIFLDLNTMAQETEDISKEVLLGKKVTEVFPGIKEMGTIERDICNNGKSFI